MLPGNWLFKVLLERIGLHQEPDLASVGNSLWITDNKIGPQRLAVFGDRGLDGLRDFLPLSQDFFRQAECLVQNEFDPD